MKVDVEGVNQHVSLIGGNVENSLVLLLPTGERITAIVSESSLETLMGSVGYALEHPDEEGAMPAPEGVLWDGSAEEETSDVAPGSFANFVGADQEVPEEESNEEMVDWEKLPEEVLPDAMKQTMVQLQVAKQLPMSALIKVTDQIAERMMAQATLAQPPTPQRARVMNAVPPRRTVPTNDMGYPQVPGLDQDPGELAQDADEDGVAQL